MPGAGWRHLADRWLLLLAAIALAASLFDPGVMTQRPLVDHVVVIDVTQSMNVTDERIDGEPVSRLAFAKQALRQSLLRMPCGSKVGWAVFTEYRALLLLSPIEVCANLKELRSTLARIDTRMAWSGNSEIAKGLHSAIGIAKLLPDKPSLVFVTDGQEAPPLNPRYRPAFDDKPGDVAGLIVGVGDLRPSPIPKTDQEGNPLGFWRPDEVAQTDLRSQGRNASVRSEGMVDDVAGTNAPTLGATPGSEHMSALRESYLRLLAGEQGLEFVRLQSPERLAQALMAPALTRPEPARFSLAGVLAAVAWGLLVARYALSLRVRRRASRAGLKTRAS
ncbi:vWA domain-containing protein [Variovorax rhizosphaerae]|uniref:VWA domain-containing protein n=1 Tax=Variovorax rhizosphaerae TaxID=1836200 RepID=A0ABU8WSS1_9BURK